MNTSNHQIVNFDKPFRGLSALVVDNFENMRSTISAILIDAGFDKVHPASDGEAALNILQHNKVDLIIAERQLPKMDGLELLRRVRADSKTIQLPFIMVSATLEQAEVVAAIKSGVSDFVVKPFSAQILIERIKRGMAKPSHVYASRIETETKKKLKILVVDDIPDNIQIISDILRQDYRVMAANSGERALKLCTGEAPPDLVLLDIMMPGMDGLEVCRRLKAAPGTQHIAVIFLTALDQDQQIVEGFEMGALDYITKPIVPSVVKARVAAHCRLIQGNHLLRYQVNLMLENARLKEDFDRVLQHDLKRPVSEMMKAVDLVEKYSRDPEKVVENAEVLRSSCQQMASLVENMMLVGRLEGGDYQLEPVSLNLKTILEDVVMANIVSIREKLLEIKNNVDDCIVSGEESLCRSLFNSLFVNAIEAAPRGSAVVLDMERAIKRTGLFNTITIHNAGAIPEEVRDTFFDKYSTHGKKNAAGLGTYAAKMFTEVQHGEISFKSSARQGTDVSVSLPV
ncbi:MAG: hypothetical protein AseanaTS_25120 [Candidatus Pelagadaptatus aseana]|uniref:response regulator n=1 Tax=Candidatus Pelagadaptatus aseana TaxID=3120508 RepID=UPI0039B1BD62